MDTTRRHALKTGGGVTLLTLLAAAGWLKPGEAAAEDWNKAAFETKSMDETMKALGGGAPATSADIIFFSTPDIAENGAVVPIGITSKIAEDANRSPSWSRRIPTCWPPCSTFRAGTDPSLSTRVKMGQTSNVYALVKADGKYYVASKEIKVTLGGCGG